MTARSSSQVLRDGLVLAHQRLNLILIDIVWRGIWFALMSVALAGLAIWLGNELRSFEWQGPDLAVPRPILLLVAARQFWEAYSGTLLVAAMGFAILATVLWLVLEAYFRGGREHFWIFIGSSASRLTILATASLLLGFLAYRDESRWALAVALVILFSLALMVVILETLIRLDAIELWATDLFAVTTSIGLSFVFEVLTLVLLTAVSGSLILSSSRLGEFAVALIFSALAFGIWSVFHSYLLVLRFSTVDIMRRSLEKNVRGV